MKATDIKPLGLYQDGRTVLKALEPYDDGSGNIVAHSFEVVCPKPPRTSVLMYGLDGVRALKPATDTMVSKYEAAWGFR